MFLVKIYRGLLQILYDVIENDHHIKSVHDYSNKPSGFFAKIISKKSCLSS